jgi:cell division protein FtsZ
MSAITNTNRLDSLDFNIPSRTTKKSSIIKVIGVGGSGCNAVNHMYAQGIKDVEFVICNTDIQALNDSPVPTKIQLGLTVSEGLGAGAQPEKGKNAAIESESAIIDVLDENTKMVFVTAGMGGGTGTGAAPVIAKMCREKNILTIGIVTTPFGWEGDDREMNAIAGLAELEKEVDSLIIIENEKLDALGDIDLDDAFAAADNVLCYAAKGIAEIITSPSKVNVDFEDVRTVLQNSGRTVMNTGKAAGEGRAIKAIENALDTPLISDNDIAGTRRMLLFISSPSKAPHKISTREAREIGEYIQKRAGKTKETKGASLIWGIHYDDTLTEEIVATVVAAGFNKNQKDSKAPDTSQYISTTQAQPTTIHINADGTTILPLQTNALGNTIQPIDTNHNANDVTLYTHTTPEITTKRTTLAISNDPNADVIIPENFDADRNNFSGFTNRQPSVNPANYSFIDPKEYEKIITQPAYLRRNADLGMQTIHHSSQTDFSQYSIDKNANVIKKTHGANNYLNPNID